MNMSGGCYCGALRYEISGDAPMRGLCFCMTCQKISGGAGNLFMGLEEASFCYTKGTPAIFSLNEASPAREFCSACGVHIAARSPKAIGGLIVKVGTMDDPSLFGGPKMVFWRCEKQAYHYIPEGIPVYETLPGHK